MVALLPESDTDDDDTEDEDDKADKDYTETEDENVAIPSDALAAIQAEDALRGDDDDDDNVGGNADNADVLATIIQALHDLVKTPTSED